MDNKGKMETSGSVVGEQFVTAVELDDERVLAVVFSNESEAVEKAGRYITKGVQYFNPANNVKEFYPVHRIQKVVVARAAFLTLDGDAPSGEQKPQTPGPEQQG